MSSGNKLLPSNTRLPSPFVPIASTTVGRISSEITGASMVRPPENLAGQLTTQGVRIPPSYKLPLKPRKIPLFAFIAFAPPLSVRKKNSVFSQNPSSFSFFTTDPTPRSR